jgi:DNA-directed RNA polymerase subunit RPC12/RpoP
MLEATKKLVPFDGDTKSETYMLSFLKSTDDKTAGMCPRCKQIVSATVSESNLLRRDICQCPNCSARILVCRGLGCHDYAQGGKTYDDEYCDPCFKSIVRSVAKTVKDMPQKLKEQNERLRQQQTSSKKR